VKGVRVAGRGLTVRERARRRGERLLLMLARPVGLLVRALPSLAGLVLLSFGAGLVYRPAGFITAGLLVLADVVAGRVAEGRAKAGGG
jgi:hypothetical protein